MLCPQVCGVEVAAPAAWGAPKPPSWPLPCSRYLPTPPPSALRHPHRPPHALQGCLCIPSSPSPAPCAHPPAEGSWWSSLPPHHHRHHPCACPMAQSPATPCTAHSHPPPDPSAPPWQVPRAFTTSHPNHTGRDQGHSLPMHGASAPPRPHRPCCHPPHL